jgi:hypothetical protein
MIRCSIVAFVFALTSLVPSVASGQGTIQQIEGSTSLFGVKGVSVPPIKRSEIRSLIDLGTIDTDGHEKVILNLAGQMLGVDENGGTIGVILIPDIAPFDQAFSGFGLLPASLEITVAVNSRETSYFMASQQKFDIGFPRYRALAYNTTRSPVNISFFAYRTR